MALQRATSTGLPQRASSGVPCSLLRARSVSPPLAGTGLALLASPVLPTRTRRGASTRARGMSEVADRTAVTSAVPAAVQPVDAFVQAATRLKNLLSGVGDGEDEMVDQLVAEESPESRLQTSTTLAAMITAVSVVISLLCGKDPLGGASLSMETASAAAVGAAAAIPLVALRMWSWTPQATKVVPQLHDMHINQLQMSTPWFTRMNMGQVALMMALEVIPLTMLLYPAAQGGIVAAMDMYSHMIHFGSTFGDEGTAAALATQAAAAAAVAAEVSGGAGAGVSSAAAAAAAAASPHSSVVEQLSALALTAGIAGLGKGLETSVAEEEYEVVRAAMDNSDRYYRVMSMDAGGSSDAQRASIAFKSVALAWMQVRNEASAVAAAQTFLDVLLMGGMWYATGNLAAPVVASLMVNWVDYRQIFKMVSEREQKAARHNARKEA